MQSIPCFYHPTTVILIDDDQDFLDSLQLALAPHYKTKAFISPQTAQQFIEEDYKKYLARKNNYLKVAYESLAEFHVSVAISSIYQMLFDLHRFAQVMVAIIDYDMPETNGLDLARQLKAQTPIKIIMLTGEADQSIAVRALNHQVIDCFILKSAKSHTKELLKHCARLQQDYFVELSRGILESLNSEGKHPLQDRDFISMFHRLCTARHIVEFYLVDESGSFILLNATGQPTWLIVRTQSDMQTFYELAENETNTSTKLLIALRNREKIVRFQSLKEADTSVESWILHDATQLAHKEIYYCVLQGSEGYDMDIHRVESYTDFLRLAYR